MKKLLKFIVFVSLIGCSSKLDNSIDKTDFTPKLNLESLKIKRFPTYSGLSGSLNSIGFFRDSIDYFSVVNPGQNQIVLFDYDSEEIVNLIELQMEGPNGIGNLGLMSSHSFISRDSLLVYNLQTGNLFLLHGSGVLGKKIPMTDYSSSDPLPTPFPNSIRPIQFKDSIAYMAVGSYRVLDYDGLPSVISVNIFDEKVNFLGSHSKLYSEAYWGNTFKYDPAIGVLGDNIVINYPVDFNLYYSKISTFSINKIEASSVYFNSIPYFKEDSDYFLSVNQNEKNVEEDNYSLSTSDFAGILTDKWNNLIYRIAYIRPTLAEVQGGIKIPDFSIIILNQKFEKVGEMKFDGKIYDCSMIFISADGLNIFRKDLYSQNEDFLSFEVFSPSGS